eukprot:4702503-Prymnesium_polylepis.1
MSLPVLVDAGRARELAREHHARALEHRDPSDELLSEESFLDRETSRLPGGRMLCKDLSARGVRRGERDAGGALGSGREGDADEREAARSQAWAGRA